MKRKYFAAVAVAFLATVMVMFAINGIMDPSTFRSLLSTIVNK